MEDDGILHTGEWEEIGTTTSAEDGAYAFANLPIADAYGRPYSYRVRMEKPAGAEYVPLKVGADRDIDNDYAHLNLLGEVVDATQGTTGVLPVLVARQSGANAYGQAYTVLSGCDWTHDAKCAVNLGIYKEPVVDDGWLTRVFYKVKKLAQTGDIATLLRLILAVIAGLAATMLVLSSLNRRKEEEDDGRWIDIIV